MQPNDLISSYEFPPGMAARIESAFDGLNSIGIAYLREKKYGDWRFHGKSGENGERIYRALEQYAAQVVSDLFSGEEGRKFHDRVYKVMTESQYGVLFKGLPKDPAIKCLFVIGLKALVGDNEGMDRWEKGSLPQVIARPPVLSFDFHRDGDSNLNIKAPEERSFLFMGSAQQGEMSAPTLFNLAKDPRVSGKDAAQPSNDHHVAVSLQPDEVIFVNNKTITHSTGKQEGASNNPRNLFRYIVYSSTLAHPREHINRVSSLMKNVPRPENQKELKEWLLKKLPELKTYDDIQFGR